MSGLWVAARHTRIAPRRYRVGMALQLYAAYIRSAYRIADFIRVYAKVSSAFLYVDKFRSRDMGKLHRADGMVDSA